MSFDPFGVQAYHEEVRRRIANGGSGLAQSEIGTGGILVSYEVGKSITHAHLIKETLGEILGEMAIDVARGEGIAGPKTFLKSQIVYMVDDRRSYPKSLWPKKHKEADALEDFYLKDGAPGAKYLK